MVAGAGCSPIAEAMAEVSSWYRGQGRIGDHSEAVDMGFVRPVEDMPAKTLELGDRGSGRHLIVVPGSYNPAVVEGPLDMHLKRCHKHLVGRNRAVEVPLCLN